MGSLVINDVVQYHPSYPAGPLGPPDAIYSHETAAPHRETYQHPPATAAPHDDTHAPHPRRNPPPTTDPPSMNDASQTAASATTGPRVMSQDYSNITPSSDSQPSQSTPQRPPPNARQPASPLTPTHTGSSSQASPNASPSSSRGSSRIKVRDLAHIQSFALDGHFARRAARRTRDDWNDVGPQYEISGMPIMDIIEMVAGILTKITTTNDQQHDHLHRQIPPLDASAINNQQTTSVLAFHGKNVPSITILSYLARIHKYCPTTYEVFLSLLVYFDRMTERVNSRPLQSMRQMHQQMQSGHDMAYSERSNSTTSSRSASRAASVVDMQTTDRGRPEASQAPSLSTTTRQTQRQPAAAAPTTAVAVATTSPTATTNNPSVPQQMPLDAEAYANLAQFFVVDSFNIHRLVIAGVTCASKFFSDIFYTNSRYAKVGGLPLVELNHLELQFLLLNDFRLAIPAEEMEAYGTMLVEFYAREVVAQQQGLQAMEGMYAAS